MTQAALVEAARAEAAGRWRSLQQAPDLIPSLGTAAVACFRNAQDLGEARAVSATEQNASLLQLLIVVRAVATEHEPAAEGLGHDVATPVANASPTGQRLSCMARCLNGHPELMAVATRRSANREQTKTPVARLMNCIMRVMGEKRRQFLHYRLQSLVFKQTKLRAQDFELPESIAKSRSVQAIQARQAWWACASGHPELLRKHTIHAQRPSPMCRSAPGLVQAAGTRGNAVFQPPCSTKDKLTSKTPQNRAQARSSTNRKISISYHCLNETADRKRPSSIETCSANLPSTLESHVMPNVPKQHDHDSWRLQLKSGRCQPGHPRRRKDEKRQTRRGVQLQRAEQNLMACVFKAGDGHPEEEDCPGGGAPDLGNADDSCMLEQESGRRPTLSRLPDFLGERGPRGRQFSGMPVRHTEVAEAVPMLRKAAVVEWASQVPMSSLPQAALPLGAAPPGCLLPMPDETPSAKTCWPTQTAQSLHGAAHHGDDGAGCRSPSTQGVSRQHHSAAAAVSQLTEGSLPLARNMGPPMKLERPRTHAENRECSAGHAAPTLPRKGILAAEGDLVVSAGLPQQPTPPGQQLSPHQQSPSQQQQQRQQRQQQQQQQQQTQTQEQPLQQQSPQQQPPQQQHQAAQPQQQLPQPLLQMLQPQQGLLPARECPIDARIDRALNNSLAQQMRAKVKSRGIGHMMRATTPLTGSECPRKQLANSFGASHAAKPDAGWEGSASNASPQQQLPRPPRSSSVMLSQNPRSSWSGATAEHAYLAESALRKRLPTVPMFLESLTKKASEAAEADEGPPAVNADPLDFQYLNMDDDQAAPLLVALQSQGAAFTALLLAGNPRLTDATYLPLLQLACGRSSALGVRPQRLDLSGAREIGERSLVLLAQELYGELSELRALIMDSVTVAKACWPALESSIAGLPHLEELGLADMQIGRASQRSAASIAEMLVGLPSLRSLDLSNNFFGLEGCRALAENLKFHRSLERLDLSHNAGGFIGTPLAAGGRFEAKVGGGAAKLPSATPAQPSGGSCVAFNPLSLVCEGVSQARALRVLKLAHCGLSFDEDFLLEEALAEKLGVSMEELDLSDNPTQGFMGVRCLLRLLMQQPALQRLELRELREALLPPASVSYEAGDPSANYALDLTYPQHRALLRALLRRCREHGKEEDLFQFRGDSVQVGRDVLNAWRGSRSVPAAGQLAFSFVLPPPVTSVTEAEIEVLIGHMDSIRKLRVNIYGFIRICDLFKHLSGVEARRIFTGAMACDLTLNLSHVRYLAGLDSRLRQSVIDKLLPAVKKLDRMGGFDLVLSTYTPETGMEPLHLGRPDIFRLLLFNPACPNGHYSLNLVTPADRRVLEQIIIVNGWEQARAKSCDHADLSQWGGHECLRNSSLDGCKVIWRNSEFTMPPRGQLSFDYCSPFHPPADAELVSNEVLDRLVCFLKNAQCDPLPKATVLRSELHRLSFCPQHCARLLEVFPSVGSPVEPDLDGKVRAPEEMEVPPSARVDAFVALYSRCADIGGLVSTESHGCYSLKALSREEVHMVRLRLGRLRTWDITRCDEEELCRWDLIMGPRSSDWRLRRQEADEDGRRWQGMLQEFHLLDDPTSRGNANRYKLDLGVPEDRQFASILLKLAQKEPGEHFDDPYWSAKEKLFERGARWIVPEDWYTEIPKDGIFRVRYFVERGQCRDPSLRRALAVRYLGW